MAKNMPEIGDYKYGFHDRDISIFRSGRGLTTEVVETVSQKQNKNTWQVSRLSTSQRLSTTT